MKRKAFAMGFLLLMLGVVIVSTAGCAPNIYQLYEKQDVEGLIRALDYRAPEVRQNAANALGNIGDPRAVEPLIVALKDENLWVCDAATSALVKIGEPAV